MNELSVFEKLSLATIRIECELRDGLISTGTGFFMKFVANGDSFVPAIITNKHVVRDTVRCHLIFTLSDQFGNPAHDSHHKFEVTDFEKAWRDHPDPNIDLCAMPINVFVDHMQKIGIKPYFTFFELSYLMTPEDIEQMIGMERVVMVGYPNGLWDEKHNQPVFRSGVLASHYRFNWNGKPEFLIDAACIPGSSGSPILILDIGQVLTKKGWSIGSSRIKLLGVLYAGPVLAADGSIEVMPGPMTERIRMRTMIPINLGYAIKGNKLCDFEEVFARELGKYRS